MRNARFWFASGIVGVALLGGSLVADDASVRLAGLEQAHGGRLGVCAIDTAGQRRLEYRADERFAMCSTFKLALAAAVLARSDAGQEVLTRTVAFAENDLLEYAPVTRERVGNGGMTVMEFCAAIIGVSDNTAANLLLATVGGPAGFTAWLRSLGDETTRLDRTEPTLNENRPGDPRDTTTPSAMAETVRRLLVGGVLRAESRERLLGWLESSPTGKMRLRAGFPAGWRVGDKTGSGLDNATNDLAIVFPPGRPPLIMVVYYTGSREDKPARDAVLAEVARLVVAEFTRDAP